MITPVLSVFVGIALAGSDTADHRLLSEVVAAAAQHAKVEVLAQKDVRLAADLEADRQMLGACVESSCMSELASALNARYVLSTTVGDFDGERVATLSLFDSSRSQAERRVVRAQSISALVPLAEAAVKELVAGAVESLPPTPPTKILVLDVEGEKQSNQAAAGSSLGVAGIATLGVGGAVVVAGVLCDVLSFTGAQGANDLSVPAAEAATARANSDLLAIAAGTAYVGAAVALVVGTGLIAVSALDAAPAEGE